MIPTQVKENTPRVSPLAPLLRELEVVSHGAPLRFRAALDIPKGMASRGDELTCGVDFYAYPLDRGPSQKICTLTRIVPRHDRHVALEVDVENLLPGRYRLEAVATLRLEGNKAAPYCGFKEGEIFEISRRGSM